MTTKSIIDIEKISNRYLLKRIKYLTENDMQVSVAVNRLYQDFDTTSVKTDFERDIFVSKLKKRLDIIANKNFLNIDKNNNEYFLSKEGQYLLKPFYEKVPWWALIIALIGLIPFIF